METGKIDNSKLHEISTSPTGLTSFSLSGNEIKLQAGSIWIRPEDKDNKKGYNILYDCKEHHQKCQLILPED